MISALDRRDRGDMVMTYKILNHRVEMDARFMKMNTESRTRGHTKKLKISLSQIEIRRNFFTNRIKKRWNDLSQEVINAKTIDTFKRAYFFTNSIMKRWNGLSQEIINSKTINAFKRAYDQEQGLIRRLSTTGSWLTAVNQP